MHDAGYASVSRLRTIQQPGGSLSHDVRFFETDHGGFNLADGGTDTSALH
jgi:hypothetical protein